MEEKRCIKTVKREDITKEGSQASPDREHLIFVKTLLLAPSFFLLPLFSWLLTPDS
jgi:hypothetical protein